MVAETSFTQFLSEVTPGEFITAVIAGIGVIVTVLVGRSQRLRDEPDVVLILSSGDEYPASAYRPLTDTFEGARQPVIRIKIQNRTARSLQVGGLRASWLFGSEHDIPLSVVGPNRIIDAESSRDSYLYVSSVQAHASPLRRTVLPLVRLTLIDAAGRRCASKRMHLSGS